MNTQDFLKTLAEHPEKSLYFEYLPNTFVAANYHITEVKHITVDSVDCGAQTDHWKETIVQLWESPQEKDQAQPMTAYKALGILNKVGKLKAYNLNSEIKLEYGNTQFHTTQLPIHAFEVEGHKLIIKLKTSKTQCKAEELCGIAPTEKEEAVTADACCQPGGGCC